ncbi:MAG TPA: beta-N-acetylhexosaminidase [Vicinamibacterales bacterium]|nr:beta-N-acetylhexosaminidase [Vicinamibacterales bacterium]HPW20881.1 beta-N-acetylhexosaminidase [Vicinamibacterales bacterium]
MSPLGLRRRVGQLVFLGFDGFEIPPEIRSLAREFDLGGVALFRRNVEGPGQVADLAFQAAALGLSDPAWVAVDQEGGRVARMRSPFTEWPPMAALGRSGNAELAARIGRAIAHELRAVGVTMDFAPVLDVLTNAANPAIGDRALSEDAGVVARLGAAMIRAMQDEGIAACGKHFPGHGDAGVDSHHDLPVVGLSPDRFEAVEWVPFRAAMAESVAALMVAHLLVPAFDEAVPASLSRRVVTGLLRERLRFDGLILTDDLSMKGCSLTCAPPAAAVRAIAAGHDAALLCEPDHDGQAAALEALVRALEDETIAASQVEASLARHARAKARFAGPRTGRPASAWREVVGCEAHQALAAELRRYA